MDEVITEEKQPVDAKCNLDLVVAHHNVDPEEVKDGKLYDGKSFSDHEGEIEDIEHHLEESIRDVCMLRKSIPRKCGKLLEECLAILTPSMEKIKTTSKGKFQEFKFDEEKWQTSIDESKTHAEYWQAIKDIKMLSEEFTALEGRCKELINMTDVQKGMGMNDTQELLYSGKRKSEAEDKETEESTSKRAMRPNCDNLPSLSSPELRDKKNKAKNSSSKIPRLKKEQSTPMTPLTRSASLRKTILKKSVGKT